jgi:hypothetical protein
MLKVDLKEDTTENNEKEACFVSFLIKKDYVVVGEYSDQCVKDV